MKEIKRSVLVIGQLLGVILGEDFSAPASQTMSEYPNGECII